MRCKTVEDPTAVADEFGAITAALFDARADLLSWSFETEDDWDLGEELRGEILESADRHLASRAPIRLRHVNLVSFRRLLGRQDGSRLRVALSLGLGVVGYLLSPFSLWNDLFVNILPSVALARLVESLVGGTLLAWASTFYVASNLAGVLLMWIAAQSLAEAYDLRPSARQWMSVAVYTAFLFVGMLVFGLAGGDVGIDQFLLLIGGDS